jgi:hypothetical protein
MNLFCCSEVNAGFLLLQCSKKNMYRYVNPGLGNQIPGDAQYYPIFFGTEVLSIGMIFYPTSTLRNFDTPVLIFLVSYSIYLHYISIRNMHMTCILFCLSPINFQIHPLNILTKLQSFHAV